MSKFRDYYNKLDSPHRDAFCRRADLSRRYVDIHLMAPKGPRKGASVGTIKRIAKASRGKLKQAEVFDHFAL